MDIIESITGKLNINLGNMNNPNIIIEGIKIDNSEDSSEEDEEEEEEEDDDEEEEEDDEEEEEEDDEEENENNNQNNNENNNESNSESGDENNEEDNNELQTFNLKKKKFILNLNEFQYKHIKKYSKNKEKKCSICLIKYQKPDILKEFPCKHIYHKNCILKWLDKSNICPLWKYDIINDVNKIEIKNTNDEENNEEEEDEEKEEEEEED